MESQAERNDEPVSSSGAESSESRKEVPKNAESASKFNKGLRFWVIIATLCVIGLLSALENTVVTTSLPFIVTQLGLGENYIWVTNIFFLTRYPIFKSLLPSLTFHPKSRPSLFISQDI